MMLMLYKCSIIKSFKGGPIKFLSCLFWFGVYLCVNVGWMVWSLSAGSNGFSRLALSSMSRCMLRHWCCVEILESLGWLLMNLGMWTWLCDFSMLKGWVYGCQIQVFLLLVPLLESLELFLCRPDCQDS